jgi:signal transduction histidine kinase
MELTDKEKEVHELVRRILKDKKNPELEHAIKYCNLALKSNGNELREAIQYLLGNAIRWAGQDHQTIKLALRKFSFRQPATYHWKKKPSGEDND